jgi:hypothetical protein
MLTLLRNGGYPPMLFILITGLLCLGAAFYFAIKAKRTSLGFIKKMMLATLFGTLAASCADVGATLYATEKILEKSEADYAHAGHLLIEGLAESTSPGILGFSFLALTFMLVAVGQRRLDAREQR